MGSSHYKAIFSSDWNECLAPCGPFDLIAYAYPDLSSDLKQVFRQYTSNRITLKSAIKRIEQLMPAPIDSDQVDAYLRQHFKTYTGVIELILWCESNEIAFMINTTGMIGYFQRIFALKLLPQIPILSANPLIRFKGQATDPPTLFELFETSDKGINTQKAITLFNISQAQTILMGDSGGDGPHFLWGKQHQAFIISSMAKPSLSQFCQSHDIQMDFSFGLSYAPDQSRLPEKEMQYNFIDLIDPIREIINVQR